VVLYCNLSCCSQRLLLNADGEPGQAPGEGATVVYRINIIVILENVLEPRPGISHYGLCFIFLLMITKYNACRTYSVLFNLFQVVVII